MLLRIKFKANWASVRARKQAQIVRDHARENARRRNHQYRVGDQVLIEQPGIRRKLSSPRVGPYDVTKVYTNGVSNQRKGES